MTSSFCLAWFDGACTPVNPGGTASFGVVIKDKDGTVLLRKHGLVGNGKNMSTNVAGYAGARRLLKYLSTRPPGKAVIRGDAQLIVNQLDGKWRIKKGMYLPITIETKELLAYPLLTKQPRTRPDKTARPGLFLEYGHPYSVPPALLYERENLTVAGFDHRRELLIVGLPVLVT